MPDEAKPADETRSQPQEPARPWHWPRPDEGVPLATAAAALAAVMVPAVGAAVAYPPSTYTAGCIGLVVYLGANALGMRTMWTLTWNILTVFAHVLEAEETQCALTAMGVGAVIVPWYSARTMCWRADFPRRAIIGQGQWVSDELLLGLGFKGLYLHEVGGVPWVRAAFAMFDNVLHLLPMLILCQHYAWRVTPAHVVLSLFYHCLWVWSLAQRYIVFDFVHLWETGRVRWESWGEVSYYEPSKIFHLYRMNNSLVPDDHWIPLFSRTMVTSIGLAHLGMFLLCMTPWSGSFFFTIGAGHLVSAETLLLLIPCKVAVGCVLGAVGFGKLVLVRLTGPPAKKDE